MVYWYYMLAFNSCNQKKYAKSDAKSKHNPTEPASSKEEFLVQQNSKLIYDYN